jgi:hypothetical protein
MGCIEVAAQLHGPGCNFLYRLRSVLKVRVLYTRGPGDCQVRVRTTVRAPGCAPRKIVLEARLITYRIAGGEVIRLLTDILDDAVEEIELSRLYHERWDAELGFDELKTHLGSKASGTLHTTFRGRRPAMVEQGIGATLALCNMVRTLMAAAGRVHGVDPRRIGFVTALETVRLALPRAQRRQGESLLALRVQLMEDLIDCVLDRYRRPRVAPRAKRLKEKPYRPKKPHERCAHADPGTSLTLEMASWARLAQGHWSRARYRRPGTPRPVRQGSCGRDATGLSCSLGAWLRRTTPSMPRISVLLVLVAALSGAAPGCGGGGGGSDGTSADVINVGLISRTTTSRRTVTLTNPLNAPATVSALGTTARLAWDAASLPASPVASGATFTSDLLLTPSASGPLSDQIALLFAAGAQEEAVSYQVTATVEVVTVEALPGSLEFGNVVFGAEVQQSFAVRNRSGLSPVTYTSASLPTNDATVVSPAFPFTLDPSSERLVTLRWRPFNSMSPIDAMATLNPSSTVGSVGCRVRVTPVAGMATIELGTQLLTNGLSEELTVQVPAAAWALQIEAWREGHAYPDYANALPDPNLPHPARELISFANFDAPDGTDHTNGWWAANGSFAASLPTSPDRADQLTAGGGTYRFQLRITDPPASPVPMRVRALVKGAPGGARPAQGALDLNLWIDMGTGLTAATAATDPALQAAIAWFDALLRTRNIALGDIDYYEYVETNPTGFTSFADRLAAIRATLLGMPAGVQERPNVFIGNHNGGSGGRTPGCATARSNHNAITAGYLGNLNFLLAHEVLHYLGLWHVGDRSLDVVTGGQPPNVMDPGVGQTGTTLSPWQGILVHAHPFVR